MRIRSILIVFLLAACLILTAIPAYAADYQSILNCKVFHNLLETDDQLYVFHIDVHYDVLPTPPINKYFHFRLLDVGGIAELASATPYAYYNIGYDESCISFYFDADDAPTWGSAFVFKLSGNPEYHAAPIPEASYTLTAADYTVSTDQEENQDLLGDFTLQIAHSLQTDWGATMTEYSALGEVLTPTGATYMSGAIPNLKYLAPGIFSTQVQQPSPAPTMHSGDFGIKTETFSGCVVALGETDVMLKYDLYLDAVANVITITSSSSGATPVANAYVPATNSLNITGLGATTPQDLTVTYRTLSQSLVQQQRYAGTWLGDFLTDDMFGMTGRGLLSFGVAILALGLFILSFRLFLTTIPGLVGAYILIVAAYAGGIMTDVIFGVVTFTAVLYIGYILFFRNAS